MRSLVRLSSVLFILAGAIVILPRQKTDVVLADSAPAISINIANAGPREVEDTTQRAVARDYSAAWQAMTRALDQNRMDLLNASFIGEADDRLSATITDQRKNGLHQRIVDRSHKVDAVFYSPEGSAIELHDTTEVQLQLMDGDKVIHSEDATIHYVVLLTAAENSWKIRVLEAVPSF